LERVLSTEQMRQWDKAAIEEVGIPGVILMENAGLKAAQCLAQSYGPMRDKRVAVVCGKGNNGGDGFVIGRHLRQMGAVVSFWLLAKKRSDLRGDARVNMEIAAAGAMTISDIERWDQDGFENCDLIVDALLGTGLKGDVSGVAADLIRSMNAFQGPVVAVDSPSGLNCDTGRPLGVCVAADLTITMGQIKTGMLLYPGRGLVGRLRIADLSVPAGLNATRANQFLPGYDDYRGMLPRRRREAHKNRFGKTLVLAGSTGLTGAAKLCAESALRSGAGMVTLGCPARLNAIFEAGLTEVMTVPLPDTPSGSLKSAAVTALEQSLDWCDVVALGPGLGSEAETRGFVVELLKSGAHHPLVIDADGLNHLADDTAVLKAYEHEVVLTPHLGEFARLTGMAHDEISQNPVSAITQYAQAWGVVILLKGATTLVANPAGEVYFNLTGNSGMATAGSGDVLTGLIAGFLGQGLDATQSAVLAAFVHGAAGDAAAARLGERGMTAGDLLERIPATMKELEEQPSGPIAAHLAGLWQ
jgi:hydroxyethylthiazole kinase-like uncharacterized protein yjeF